MKKIKIKIYHDTASYLRSTMSAFKKFCDSGKFGQAMMDGLRKAYSKERKRNGEKIDSKSAGYHDAIEMAAQEIYLKILRCMSECKRGDDSEVVGAIERDIRSYSHAKGYEDVLIVVIKKILGLVQEERDEVDRLEDKLVESGDNWL